MITSYYKIFFETNLDLKSKVLKNDKLLKYCIRLAFLTKAEMLLACPFGLSPVILNWTFLSQIKNMEWNELRTYLSQKFDDAKNKNLAFSQSLPNV